MLGSGQWQVYGDAGGDDDNDGETGVELLVGRTAQQTVALWSRDSETETGERGARERVWVR